MGVRVSVSREFIEKLLEDSDNLKLERTRRKPRDVIVKFLRKYFDNLTTYRDPLTHSYEQLLKAFGGSLQYSQ